MSEIDNVISCFRKIKKKSLGHNKENLTYYFVKGNAQFIIFLCNPQKSSVNVCLMKILKSTVTKKVIVCFYDLGEENF